MDVLLAGTDSEHRKNSFIRSSPWRRTCGEDGATTAADGKLMRKDVLLQPVSVMPEALKRLPLVAAITAAV